MEKILYILNSGDNISPFDVTMAADAGFDHIIPFNNVNPKDVTSMIQDAIFARPPKHFNDTSVFFGGRDVHLAANMFHYVKKAMVGPFEVSVFADPNGAYTASASILSLIQKTLKTNYKGGLEGRTVAIFGTGPVGLCTAILAIKEGAKVKLCTLTSDDDNAAIRFIDRYKVSVDWVSTITDDEKIAALQGTEIIICCAKAGIRILDISDLNKADNLLVVADASAVPPSGVDGIGMDDDNTLVSYANGTFRSIGPLTIGTFKSQIENGIFKHLQESDKAEFIDFPEAYEFALAMDKV